MNLSRAALAAIAGVILRGLAYWVANLIPSWGVADTLARVVLIMVSIVDPAAWSVYFLSVSRGWKVRWPAVAAAAVGIFELVVAILRQYDTFSLLSQESILFLLGAILPVLCWTLVLVAQAYNEAAPRWSLWYLLLLSMLQAAWFVYQLTASRTQIAEFWREEPWILVIAPAIWLTYWVTQAVYIRALQLNPIQRAPA